MKASSSNCITDRSARKGAMLAREWRDPVTLMARDRDPNAAPVTPRERVASASGAKSRATL
ncbi:hypothetical protein ACT9ST_08850 [Sphingobium limneticum]|jgi:hypothetical protein|uniref:hypothetical protein n=1 Tax=Sphingobium limneticum TaxID=1007511 RepID=UPI000DBB78E7|nr:hypothetical protein [Sphingobium limneticum]BBD00408.1 hypothetical protein YGS_C1P1663 [Sphingobium sp. YG1]